MRPSRRAVIAGVLTIVVVLGVTSASVAPPRGGRGDGYTGPFVATGLEPSPSTPTATPATADPTGTGGAGNGTVELAAAKKAAREVQPLTPAEAIRELRQPVSSGSPRLAVDERGHISSVAAPAGAALKDTPGAVATTDPETAAAAFVNRYGQGFGLRPGQSATLSRIDAVPGGDRIVRLQQRAGGVPVLGGDLMVSVDPSGHVVNASAKTPAGAAVTVTAALSAEAAGTRAIKAAADREGQFGVGAKDLVVTKATLWLFDPRAFGVPGRAELRSTWWVTLGQAGRAGDVVSVLIDATDGSTSLAFSARETAKNRLVCDLANATGLNIENDYTTYDCSDDPGGPAIARREGQAPVASTEVNTAYDILGAVYDFYLSNFGRDSIDGHGMPMAGTVRACQLTCPYENAFWDGYQMVFGTGLASADDVVGHELTHGVTQHTSDLYYLAESGGINEALSDIFGEFIDQTRGTDNDTEWTMGEDLPASIGIIRSLKSPTLYQQPEYKGGQYWSAGYNDWRDNYGVHTLGGPLGKTAYLLGHTGTETFRGETVTGIGIPKSAQIWYRLQFMLGSAAKLTDVGLLLPEACASILGVKGITPADCDQVERAVRATALVSHDSGEPSAKCLSGGVPQDIFFDDFEAGTVNWTLPGNTWQLMPSSDIPVSWATSGSRSLYASSGGTPGLAVLRNPIPTYPGRSIYFRIASNVASGQGGGKIVIDQGDGNWSAAALTLVQGGSLYSTFGYDATVYLYQGTADTVRVALQPTPMVANSEWLVDDVEVYECNPLLNGPPRTAGGTLSSSRTGAEVSWAAPNYVASGGVTSYELSISPAVAGIPSSITVPAGTLSYSFAGLDPAARYTVFVRALGSAGYGPAAAVHLGADPQVDCTKYVYDPVLKRPMPPWPCPAPHL